MPDIDKLNIEITSSVTEAQRAISGLTSNLKDLKNALKSAGSGDGLKELAKEAGNAKEAEEDLAKTSEKVKKALSGITSGVDSKPVEQAAKGIEKAVKSLPKVDITPTIKVPSELENFKKKVQDAVGLNDDDRKALLAKVQDAIDNPTTWKRVNKDGTVDTGEYGDNSDEAVSNRARIKVQFLEEELKLKSSINTKTEAQVEAEKRVAEAAARRTEEYKKAKAAMKEALGDTGYKISLGDGYRHNGEVYTMDQFMPGGSRAATDESADSADKSTSAFERLKSTLAGVGNAFSSINYNASKAMVSIASAAGAGVVGMFKRLTSGAAAAGRGILKLGSALASTNIKAFKSAVSGVAKATRGFAGAIAQLSGKLAAMPFRPLTKHISGFGSNVKTAVGNASKAFSSGLKTVLKYVFGFRTLFYAVRALRGATTEAFTNLASYSSQTNSNLSLLSSGLSQLKNSLATAFDPILTVVTPLLSHLISYLVAALNAVGQFFATLTGQSTWNKATFNLKDFAAGADKSAASSGKAKEAADELKKSLMGFDKINKLDDPDKASGGSSGGGGGGGGGTDGSDMFTTETVDSGISNFAQMVKDAWEASDFTDVGRVIGEKLAEALNKIPWDTVKSTASKFGASFATLINGLVSVPGLATTLGKTIGEVINTIFAAASSFVTGIDDNAVGLFLANIMNSAVGTVDWDTIATTLSTAANKIFGIAATWSGKFNFKALGEELGTAVQKILTGLEWEKAQEAARNIGAGLADALNAFITPETFSAIGTHVAESLNTAIAGAYSFVNNAEWGEWGTSVATGLNDFFNTANLEELGVTLSTFANGVVDFIGNAIRDTDWENAANKAATAVLTAIGEFDWAGLVGLLLDVGTAFRDCITGAIEAVEWTDLPGKVVNAIVSIFTDNTESIQKAFESVGKLFGAALAAGIDLLGAIAELFADIATDIANFFKGKINEAGYDKDAGLLACGKAIIQGIFNGIVEFFKSIGTWIKTNIFDPFVNGFKEKFGIHSPAKNATIVDLGKNLIEGVFNGIVEWMKGIGKWIKEHVFDPIVDAWNAFWDDPAGTIGNIIDVGVNLVKSGWTSLKGFVGDKVDAAVKLVKDGWTALKGFVGDKVEAAVKLAKDGWDSLSGFVGSAVNVAVGLTKKAGEWAGDAWDAISSAGKTVTATVQAAVKKAPTWVGDAWDAIKTAGGDVTKTIKAAVKKGEKWVDDAWAALKTTGGDITKTVKAAVKKADEWVGDAWNALKTTSTGVTKTIQAAVKKADTWVSDAWNALRTTSAGVTKTIQAVVKKADTWVDDAWSALKTTGVGITKTIQAAVKKSETWVSDAWSALKTSGSTLTKTIKAAVKKADDWVGDAWSALKTTGAGVTKTIQAAVKKADDWVDDAWSAIKTAGGKFTTTVYALAKKHGSTVENAWTVLRHVGGKFTTTVTALAKQATGKNWSSVAWSAISAGGKTFSTTVTGIVKQATGKNWSSVAWSAISAGGKYLNSTINVALTTTWSSIQSWFNSKFGSGSTPTVTINSRINSNNRVNARGGVFYNNAWHNLPQYAGGGSPTHGTIFVAGEAGAEAVGHINGRTEVLNQSQMASVMYDAVVRGMMQALAVTGNNTNVNVYLQGDAGQMFRVVQKEANNYVNATGKPAFNV